MIGTKEHQELLSSFKSGNRDTVKKVLLKHKLRLKELCTKAMTIEELTKGDYPFKGERINALQYCAFCGSVPIMQELLDNVAKEHLKLATASRGWTVVHFAAYGGNMEMYQYLVTCGESVEARTTDGWTPLHIAIARGNPLLAVHMLVNGADISTCLPNGDSHLHLCVDRIEWMNQGFQATDRAKIINALSEKGASLGVVNKSGDTALQLCLRKDTGNPNVVAALLAMRDVDMAVKRVDTSQQTALHLTSSPLVAGMLLDACCDLDAQRNDGRTALHVHGNDSDMVRTLLARGADANIVDAQGRTPLHVALSRENIALEAVTALIASMRDVNVTDNGKNTALHLASAHSYDNLRGSKFRDPLLEILIKVGVTINLQNRRRETALHLAIRSGQYAKAGMLVRAGANVDLLDINGNSPRNLDSKWINRVLYQDPLDTSSRAALSPRDRTSSRSPAKSPRDPKASGSSIDARLGRYLTPKPSPTPSARSPNIDQLLSSSDGIDELTMKLGLAQSDEGHGQADQDGATREHLKSQISSLRDEMSCLQDILESYTLAPSSPPASITYSTRSVTSTRETNGHLDAMSDDLDRIIEDNAVTG